MSSVPSSTTISLTQYVYTHAHAGELLVHVVDVAGYVRKYEALAATSKERIATTFTPQGPLHMLPPLALEALKLSSMGPNEVITVALSIDWETGHLIGSRVFPAIIGPVFALDIDTADEILAVYKDITDDSPTGVANIAGLGNVCMYVRACV